MWKLCGLEAVWYNLGLQCIPPAFHVSALVHSARVEVPRGHFLEGGMALVQLVTLTGRNNHTTSNRGTYVKGG